MSVVDLEVLTSKGCERLAVGVLRLGLDDGLISHPLAVDLGTASPGTLGEPVDIVFRSARSDDGTIFMAGGVSDGIFEVVNPIAATPLRSCEPMRTSVRFNAPLDEHVGGNHNDCAYLEPLPEKGCGSRCAHSGLTLRKREENPSSTIRSLRP